MPKSKGAAGFRPGERRSSKELRRFFRTHQTLLLISGAILVVLVSILIGAMDAGGPTPSKRPGHPRRQPDPAIETGSDSGE